MWHRDWNKRRDSGHHEPMTVVSWRVWQCWIMCSVCFAPTIPWQDPRKWEKKFTPFEWAKWVQARKPKCTTYLYACTHFSADCHRMCRCGGERFEWSLLVRSQSRSQGFFSLNWHCYRSLLVSDRDGVDLKFDWKIYKIISQGFIEIRMIRFDLFSSKYKILVLFLYFTKTILKLKVRSVSVFSRFLICHRPFTIGKFTWSTIKWFFSIFPTLNIACILLLKWFAGTKRL